MKKGFTLIELLATLTIMVIIAMVTIPYILDKVDLFKEKAYTNMIDSIEQTTERYVNDNRLEMTELDELGFQNISIKTLVDEGYLEGKIINQMKGNSISVDDEVYVTLDYKNVIDIIFDPNQRENPKITLNGKRNLRLKLGDTYNELGVTAVDKDGNDISSSITIDSNVDMNEEGEYVVNYYIDNSLVIKRYVIVTDDYISDDIEKPQLSSNVSGDYIETTLGVSITMPVVTAVDNVDGTISPISYTSNDVDIYNTGTYYIKYDYTDSSNNRADTLTVTVVVKP